MGFGGWTEVFLDANMDLGRAELEPASATCPKFLWLFDFWEAEEVTEELSSRVFTTLGGSELDMVYVVDERRHFLRPKTSLIASR